MRHGDQAVQIKDAFGKAEHICRIRRRGRAGSDHLQQREGSLGPDRIIHRQNTTHHNVDARLQLCLHLRKLCRVLHRRNPVQQQPHLTNIRAHFRHLTLAEQIDFDQLIQRIQSLIGVWSRVFQIIKARDYRRRAHLGVRHQSIGNFQQLGRGSQTGIQPRALCRDGNDAVLHQTVKPLDTTADIGFGLFQPCRDHIPRAFIARNPLFQRIGLGNQIARTFAPCRFRRDGRKFGCDHDNPADFLGKAAHFGNRRNGLLDDIGLVARDLLQLDPTQNPGQSRQARDDQKGHQQHTPQTDA